MFFQCSQHKQLYTYTVWCFHYFVHLLYFLSRFFFCWHPSSLSYFEVFTMQPNVKISPPLSVTSTLHKASLSSYTQLISSLADHEALIHCPLYLMKLILRINLVLLAYLFVSERGVCGLLHGLDLTVPVTKTRNKENWVSLSGVFSLLGCYAFQVVQLLSRSPRFVPGQDCLTLKALWSFWNNCNSLPISTKQYPKRDTRIVIKIKSLFNNSYNRGNTWRIIRYFKLLEKFQM
jgi:hypothetical protein